MTLCLAGLYEDGKSAIALGDKMITYTFDGEVEDFSVERNEVTKLFRVNETTALLISGDRNFGLELIEMVQKQLKRLYDIDRIREVIVKAHNKLREKHAFHDTLFPLFRSHKQYLKMPLSREDRTMYNMKFFGYSFNLDVIIVGKRDKLYEIYVLEGGSMNPKPEGYAAIGSGKAFAYATIAEHFDKHLNRNEALDVLEAAKKVAEQTQYVGEKTDVEYLD